MGATDEPRRAGAQDVAMMASTLVEGFLDDPVYTAVFRSPGREAKIRSVFNFLVRDAFVPAHIAYVAGDCVAVLSPPELPPWPAERTQAYIEMLRAEVSADDAIRLESMAAVLRASEPAPVHWHLELIATRTRSRGQGHGAAMISALLDNVDRVAGSVLVEATSARSIPLYARLGFEVVRQVDLDGSVVITQMWRQGAAASRR